MTVSNDTYLDLVTSEHRDRPKFAAMVEALVSPLVTDMNSLLGFPEMFDLDTAGGVQLDILGLWIGVGRDISVPLEDVYFSLDSEPLGLDYGSMQGPGDPTSGVVVLPDSAYRTLLRGRIANNHWDGTMEDAGTVWAIAFAGTGYQVLIQDEQGMHMIQALMGPVPDALTFALFTGGYLNLKPAGVAIDLYITPAVPDTPYFGLDAETSAVAGLDVGQFGIETPPGG